ncbi:MAG TPA: ATP-binding protein [Myxococcota bacterium]|nr:ATP-binding protein [Myxococcota bacterium]
MVVEIGLIGALVVALWIAIDAARSPSPLARRLPLILVGLTSGLWSLGELLAEHALTPAETLAARRVLFAGASLLPVVWVWLAVDSARAERLAWLRRALGWLAVPTLLAYSCLYWDHQVRFVAWTAHPPQHGPVFWAAVAYGWLLVTVGTVVFLVAARRRGRVSWLKLGVLAGGVFLPLIGHIVFLARGGGAADPTPILVGFAGLILRLIVFDSGIAVFLPVARRDVIEQLEIGVLVADIDGCVVDANPAAAQLVAPSPVLGQPLSTLLAAARRVPEKVIEIQSAPVRGQFGEVGRFAVLTDRTASSRGDRQLLQAHRLEALGILTAGIAHEVNNPLAFVRANLSGLEELAQGLRDPTLRATLPSKLGELASDAPELVAEAIEGVERIGRLVRRLRRFARGEGVPTPYGPVDLREVAEKACALSGVGLPGGAIRRVLHPVPLVPGNEDELVQIAVNLLVNAVQASGGRPEIEVEVRSARGGVTLAVRDRGEGIPAAALPRLFDPFFTTKPPGQGTGLGLSLSFDLARQHGGTLEGANRPGGGAEFELWIPALR